MQRDIAPLFDVPAGEGLFFPHAEGYRFLKAAPPGAAAVSPVHKGISPDKRVASARSDGFF